ncbi:universal stress protein [Arthrobacter sp. B3I4]|uniref:universal stress protein n=1 Tax=Arthrobacter sp. B3I4 TaxID=3042267 RepID=UPI0027806009|nr:universal stress protein [Arthrobacter sp. B3I4]MDQ0754479.1 nucleotide-binding universal stress UspA family protein [Arthrobacter sp. B3I4]
MPTAAGPPPPALAVGYDDSDSARLAVRWAAEHAAASGMPLRVVHAWVWPVFTKNLGPVRGVAGSGLRHSAEAILADGVALARETAPGLAVEGVMEAGLPAQVLRQAADGAGLLAVGSRGMGGVLGHLAGSVCLELAGSAPCPLMVVRRPRSPGRPVAVGVDAAPRSGAVLADAARFAAAVGAGLQVVHVAPGRGGNRADRGRHAPLQGADLLEHAVAEAGRIVPGLTVSGTLREGQSAARELVEAAADADVLVLGRHERDGGVGNTVSAVLHKAPCNVMITR